MRFIKFTCASFSNFFQELFSHRLLPNAINDASIRRQDDWNAITLITSNNLLTPWCYYAPSGVGVESSPCSPLQGNLAYRARPAHSLMHDVKHMCLSLLTPWCYCAPSGVGVESSPRSPLQGNLAYRARPAHSLMHDVKHACVYHYLLPGATAHPRE